MSTHALPLPLEGGGEGVGVKAAHCVAVRFTHPRTSGASSGAHTRRRAALSLNTLCLWVPDLALRANPGMGGSEATSVLRSPHPLTPSPSRGGGT
jgi:hypothetical protein